MSGLPGHRHPLPNGATCDCHPDRAAVANVQGETDSFGFETILMCQECLAEDRAYDRSAEARTGKCDWCDKEATDLAWARDYEEGMHGPTYRVCQACRDRRDEKDREWLRDHDDGYWDYDDSEADAEWEAQQNCGRWDQNAGGLGQHCRLAGTEDCDFCPYRTPSASPALSQEDVR